ncbi:RICIN domain-containing protein [Allohahella marinimesophila]|uniref:Ricin B lectin domain-containing protein n=1 Tax=Allohahella marinimesophila TaxID=1054972 RepID=A0ABP7PMQ9_9GAMM
MYPAIANTRSQTAQKSFRKTLISAACVSGLLMSAAASAATVDVLVVYDSGAKSKLGGEPAVAMQSWVNQINGYYANSKIDIQLRLAGTVYHEESSSDMSTMLRSLQANTKIRAERDKYGADFVAMVSPKASCGIGYISVLASYAYSISGPQCGPMTMAHELGHNMGLNHSRKQGNTGGYRYGYGLGHGVDYSFSTIMAYAHVYSTSRMGKFSNPDVSCNGQPCGIPAGKPGESDAARAINNVKGEIAGFKAAVATTVAAPTPTNPTPVASKTYSFKAAHSGKCLDVSGLKKNAGATLAQWSCHGGLNQQFTATPVGNYMSLKAKHSDMCLSIENNSTGDRARLVQASCNTSDGSQLWTFKTSGSTVSMVNKRSSKYLDIRGNNSENRAAVQQYSSNGGDNQRFTLVAK